MEKELALTEEYKTALIAEAVTGKIDVRGYEVPDIREVELYGCDRKITIPDFRQFVICICRKFSKKNNSIRLTFQVNVWVMDIT